MHSLIPYVAVWGIAGAIVGVCHPRLGFAFVAVGAAGVWMAAVLYGL